MFNEQTLKLLLEKITEIEELCKRNDLKNLRIIKPESVDDWKKINILGDEDDKVLITSDLDFLKDEVSLLLDCEVMIVTDSMLRDHVKDRILQDAIPYKEDSKDKIIKLFNETLLSLAKRYQAKWGDQSIDTAEEEIDEDIFQKYEEEEEQKVEDSENRSQMPANAYSILSNQHKRKSPEKTSESREDKPMLEVRKEGGNLFVNLSIPIPKDANYDESTMVNTEIADELAKQYFVKISRSIPSPTKSS